jgi:hypothetical protein
MPRPEQLNLEDYKELPPPPTQKELPKERESCPQCGADYESVTVGCTACRGNRTKVAYMMPTETKNKNIYFLT